MRSSQRKAKSAALAIQIVRLRVGDGGLQRLGVGVDLVGAHDLVLSGEERRVDLDDVVWELRRLDRILFVVQRVELGGCLLRLEHLGEIAVDRELLADPFRCEVCPGQGPVRVPDLDAENVRSLGQVAKDDRGGAVADPQGRPVDHPRREHAVRVLRQAQLCVVESLAPHGAREEGAKDEAAAREDDCAEKDKCPEQPHGRGHPLGHGEASHYAWKIGSCAIRLEGGRA